MRARLLLMILTLAAVMAALAVLLPSHRPALLGASPLGEREIEATAIALAHTHGLQEPPRGIVSKRMSMQEFNARLDPFANDPGSVDTQAWLTVMQGETVIASEPPLANGGQSHTQYDNIWVLTTLDGEEIAWGSQARGHEIDLSQPAPSLPTAWPTPPGGNLKK